MIEPRHRDMALGMFRRGLTISAIHHAMAGALTLHEVQLLVAETSAADRRAASILRRDRTRREIAIAERARLRAERERKSLLGQFRVHVIRPVPVPPKPRQTKEKHHD